MTCGGGFASFEEVLLHFAFSFVFGIYCFFVLVGVCACVCASAHLFQILVGSFEFLSDLSLGEASEHCE
jgi:hypothetical protein